MTLPPYTNSILPGPIPFEVLYPGHALSTPPREISKGVVALVAFLKSGVKL